MIVRRFRLVSLSFEPAGKGLEYTQTSQICETHEARHLPSQLQLLNGRDDGCGSSRRGGGVQY